MPVELEFREGGRILVGSFLCRGEPEPLESGKQGWFTVSRHIDWRYGWRLRVQCSITEPQQNYGFLRPREGKLEFIFEPDYCGNLVVNDQRVTVCFQLPDCLDPPKKSFNWGQPILFGDRVFHCALRLELRGSKDGGYLRRKAATPTRVGGIEFVSPGVNRDAVFGCVPDSEAGRGRQERIEAFIEEHEPSMDAKHNTQEDFDLSALCKLREEAEEFVDNHPSRPD